VQSVRRERQLLRQFVIVVVVKRVVRALVHLLRRSPIARSL